MFHACYVRPESTTSKGIVDSLPHECMYLWAEVAMAEGDPNLSFVQLLRITGEASSKNFRNPPLSRVTGFARFPYSDTACGQFLGQCSDAGTREVESRVS